MDESELTHEEKIFAFQLKRNVTTLYKTFLNILAREKESHDEALNKLYTNLPEPYKKYVDLADSLSDNKAKALRSEILGVGNDCLRELEQQYEVLIKTKKE